MPDGSAGWTLSLPAGCGLGKGGSREEGEHGTAQTEDRMSQYTNTHTHTKDTDTQRDVPTDTQTEAHT